MTFQLPFPAGQEAAAARLLEALKRVFVDGRALGPEGRTHELRELGLLVGLEALGAPHLQYPPYPNAPRLRDCANALMRWRARDQAHGGRRTPALGEDEVLALEAAEIACRWRAMLADTGARA